MLAAHLRALPAGGQHEHARNGWSRAWAGARTAPGGGARRHGDRGQRRDREGHHLHREAACGRGARGTSPTGGCTRPREPPRWKACGTVSSGRQGAGGGRRSRQPGAHVGDLIQAGGELRVAASAAEGFRLLQQWLPDVLISDIEMPGEDGYAFIMKVRGLEPSRGGKRLRSRSRPTGASRIGSVRCPRASACTCRNRWIPLNWSPLSPALQTARPRGRKKMPRPFRNRDRASQGRLGLGRSTSTTGLNETDTPRTAPLDAPQLDHQGQCRNVTSTSSALASARARRCTCTADAP